MKKTKEGLHNIPVSVWTERGTMEYKNGAFNQTVIVNAR